LKGYWNRMDKRLNHLETELRDKVAKWEMRVWFIILMAFVSLWS